MSMWMLCLLMGAIYIAPNLTRGGRTFAAMACLVLSTLFAFFVK